MSTSIALKFVILLLSFLVLEVIPIQQESGEFKGNDIDNSQLNQCISARQGTELGVCFGKEVLNKLNGFDEAETFSLATGVSFVRDEKTPRDFGSFLDKDPMDFRSMIEDASNLISKRSLHWDMSAVYPGLVMRIGPTLANGILEFVMDPRVKDRTYNSGHGTVHGEQLSTGRLLARNLLVPFLLGFKFQLTTLLPLILGLVLLASKKAFFLAKLALLAVTVFSGGSSFGGLGGFGGHGGGEIGPSLASYTSYDSPVHYQGHHGSGAGYYHRHPHHVDYHFREKADEHTTATPITPDELKDRLERLFITRKEIIDEPREETKVRNARNFAWTPLKVG